METAPLTIALTRGPATESRHLVHAVVLDGRGRRLAVHGDARRLTFPRSALKPLQALPLLESGAAEAFALSAAEVALACASHSGEDRHVQAVAKWLRRLGLDETALECGAQAQSGQPASALRNNCSGKHAGMLTLALFLQAPLKGYTLPAHPVQQEILKKLTAVCGTALTAAVCGIDGCSAPNPAMPLESLAQGFAWLLRAESPAVRRLLKAMTAHPDLVAGTERLDTVLMTAAGGRIVAKGGAEGTYAALLAEKNAVIALKAEDGAARAAQAALYGVLERHGLAEKAVLDAIRPLALPAQKNWRGTETGEIRIVW